jgi:membrane protease YdiL (CAAX protease family)
MTDESIATPEAGIEQHSLVRSIVLHLLPGVLILVFYVIVAPLAERLGFPSVSALLIAIAVVLIPFELGYLLYQGKKKNGTLSLKGIVLYREPMPAWQYIVLALPLLVWVFLLLGILAPPTDKVIIEKAFFWLPDWFFITSFVDNLDQYSQSALLLTWVLNLVFNGVAGPLVEELYFRGYLLPRISRLGRWAPLVNSVLFSLYHFFTPWQNLVRILALLPMVYTGWWKRNIYLGIIVHCTANTLGALATLALVANST